MILAPAEARGAVCIQTGLRRRQVQVRIQEIENSGRVTKSPRIRIRTAADGYCKRNCKVTVKCIGTALPSSDAG